MNKKLLDINSLESAISQLQKAYDFSISKIAVENKDLFEQFRNSTIQCFEFTFELSWKFIKRILELEHPISEQIDQMDYKDLIREAATRGLINSPEVWFEFRRLRNISSHAYDRSKAEQVYLVATNLLKEANILLKNLKLKNR